MTGEDPNGQSSEMIRGLVQRAAEWRRYIRRRTPVRLQNRIEAEDVFQDTCVAVLEDAVVLRPETAHSADRLLARIEDRKRVNAARREEALKRGGKTLRSNDRDSYEPVSSDPSPMDQVILKERTEILATQLSQLPDAQKSVLESKYGHGLSEVEIAHQSGRSLSCVHSLICRALATLRRTDAWHVFRGGGRRTTTKP